MNINTIGIGNWNWDPWGKPEPVDSEGNAPTLLPPPPPAPQTQAVDTINIGGSSNPPPIGYQPPLATGTGVSASPEISELTDEMFIQLLPWLEVFPQGRVPMQDVQINDSMSFNEQQFAWEAPQRQWLLDNDRAAYEVSLAKDFGMSWDDYHLRIKAVRSELNIAANEEARSQGGYFDYLDTSGDPYASSIDPETMEEGKAGDLYAFLVRARASLNIDAINQSVSDVTTDKGAGYWQTFTVTVPDSQDGTTKTSKPIYKWVPLPPMGNENIYGGAGQNGSAFQQTRWPGLNFGQSPDAPPSVTKTLKGTFGSQEELQEYAKELSKKIAADFGIKGAAQKTEFGAAIFEKDGKIVAVTTRGSAKDVGISKIAAEKMNQDSRLNLLWVIHNHITTENGGDRFSDPDLRNGQDFARSPSSQLRSFQGLMLGLPGGAIKVYPAKYL